MNCRIMLVLVALLTLSSCVRVESGSVAPTIGTQVIDLVKAKELGAISEEEFRKARLRVLAAF
ncbi:MAG: hypothetical protein P8N51_06575 [Pseudomonadales bacterium]|nr:hypothetical protein [Pseudomonadales bacterium]MDG1441818.1 hypothetical protein [Pseudomonadales bacterium]